MYLFEYASWTFKRQKILGKAAVAFPKLLDGLFSHPKRHFCLSENNSRYFPHITKISAKNYSSFSSHFNPKIVGDNRSSEQILTKAVCWVPWEHLTISTLYVQVWECYILRLRRYFVKSEKFTEVWLTTGNFCVQTPVKLPESNSQITLRFKVTVINCCQEVSSNRLSQAILESWKRQTFV